MSLHVGGRRDVLLVDLTSVCVTQPVPFDLMADDTELTMFSSS